MAFRPLDPLPLVLGAGMAGTEANALPDKFNPADRTIMGIVDAVTLEELVPPPGARKSRET